MSSPVYVADIDAETAEAFWLTEPGIQKVVNTLRRRFPYAYFTTARWQAKTFLETTTFEIESSDGIDLQGFLTDITAIHRAHLLDAFKRLARPPGSAQ